MAHMHRAFVVDMLAKIGVPVFAGTLVGCVLEDDVRVIHIVLLSVGAALMYLGHRLEYHGAAEPA